MKKQFKVYIWITVSLIFGNINAVKDERKVDVAKSRLGKIFETVGNSGKMAQVLLSVYPTDQKVKIPKLFLQDWAAAKNVMPNLASRKDLKAAVLSNAIMTFFPDNIDNLEDVCSAFPGKDPKAIIGQHLSWFMWSKTHDQVPFFSIERLNRWLYERKLNEFYMTTYRPHSFWHQIFFGPESEN